jgi:membrane associated rhomboid family serine protease
MLPLYDTEPNRFNRFSWMTIALILVNTAVYIWQINTYVTHGEAAYVAIIRTFGITPAYILAREGAGIFSAVACMFLHGSPEHLFFNMLALWVFGRRVEDACGAWRFLVFYLCCGFIASIFHILVDFQKEIPAIGASGAIFGLQGAHLLLYPGGRIRTLIVWIIPFWPRIPAIWIVLYQIPLQIFSAFGSLLLNIEVRTAYWAHLGGFFGSIIIVFFLRPWASTRFWGQEPI